MDIGRGVVPMVLRRSPAVVLACLLLCQECRPQGASGRTLPCSPPGATDGGEIFKMAAAADAKNKGPVSGQCSGRQCSATRR